MICECITCKHQIDVPTSAAWPQSCPKCGSMAGWTAAVGVLTNYSRSHEAIASETTDRAELVRRLRELQHDADGKSGIYPDAAYDRLAQSYRETADLLEANAAEIARLKELPKISMTADQIYKKQRARIAELEALVREIYDSVPAFDALGVPFSKVWLKKVESLLGGTKS